VNQHDLALNLKLLKQSHGCVGLKAEFEAEGSSYRDLVLLRMLTLRAQMPLHVKIGGCEAIRDIHDCLELAVDGIIAPMIETPFAANKFMSAIEQVGIPAQVKLAINVETRVSISNLSSILDVVENKVTNVTVGRSDLSRSMDLGEKAQDRIEVMEQVWKCTEMCSERRIEVVVGGGVTARGVELIKQDARSKLIKRVETRKIMFDLDQLRDPKFSMSAALDFEKQLILFRKDNSDNRLRVDLARLTELQVRQQ